MHHDLNQMKRVNSFVVAIIGFTGCLNLIWRSFSLVLNKGSRKKISELKGLEFVATASLIARLLLIYTDRQSTFVIVFPKTVCLHLK